MRQIPRVLSCRETVAFLFRLFEYRSEINHEEIFAGIAVVTSLTTPVLSAIADCDSYSGARLFRCQAALRYNLFYDLATRFRAALRVGMQFICSEH
jgi:hypothetical protein